MIASAGNGVVEFRFYRPSVTRLAVIGEFGEHQESLLMTPLGDGWWIARAKLPAGEYRFRYVGDCHPYIDYTSDDFVGGTLGWDTVHIQELQPLRGKGNC